MRSMPDSLYAMTDETAKRRAIADWITTYDSSAERAAREALDIPGIDQIPPRPRNAFRGNGFSGTGSAYLPERSFGAERVGIPDGAELWQIRPDGTEVLVAVYRRGPADDTWAQVVEQEVEE